MGFHCVSLGQYKALASVMLDNLSSFRHIRTEVVACNYLHISMIGVYKKYSCLAYLLVLLTCMLYLFVGSRFFFIAPDSAASINQVSI